MDDDFVFEPKNFTYDNQKWVLKYCINLMADSVHFNQKLRDLLIGGETGGEIDWGIHRWAEHSRDDYNVERFDGFRAYLGPDEHGKNIDNDIDVIVSEEELRQYLLIACNWVIKKKPELKTTIEVVMRELQII